MTTQPIIKTESVSKWYNRGRPDEVRAVDGVSLQVQENQSIVLYGPSGSGKTTLLGLLGTMDRPTDGKVFFAGRDITWFSDLELSRIRREKIGVVFQSFNLISGLSAWENVSYPLIPTGLSARQRFARAKILLEKLNLGDRLHHAPEELSGGQQQRVAIARALVNDPDILIADEPTSNIDEDSVSRLLDILSDLRSEGKTLIISSHDPVLRNHGDIVFRLDQGKLADVRQVGCTGRDAG